MKLKTALTTLALLAWSCPPILAAPLGMAFTYQGKLTDGSQPAQGIYDLRFTIYDSGTGGNAIAGPQTNGAVVVSNGLFAVTLDFGSGVFAGDARWLEIAVRTNGAAGSFTVLSPRQPLLAAPYALFTPAAGSALSANTATTADAAGSFIGPLAGDVTGTQAATLVGRIRGTPVSATGPSPNHLLRYDGSQWTPGSVALATDVTGTLADVHLSSNVGLLNANQTFTGSNTFNGVVTATNTANVLVGTFTGNGAELTSLNGSSLVPGTVGGAALGANSVSVDKIAPNQVVKSLNGLRDDVTLAAGTNATLTASAQTLTISTPTDWHVGGNSATTPAQNFIGTTDPQPLELRVNGQRALRLEPNSIGAPNVIGGAVVNFVAPGAVGVTIAGGGAANYNGNAYSNAVLADYAVIAGGTVNTIEGNASKAVIGGGAGNLIQANSPYATISGGGGNWIHTNAIEATIGGGQHNLVQTNAVGATIGGGEGNTIQTNSYYGTISGGAANAVWANAYYGTVAGGWANAVGTNAIYGAVGGGWNNTAGGAAATVAGGSYNAALAKLGVVGGGELNIIEGEASRATIGGGGGNVVQSNSTYATISGGWGNGIQTNSSLATIGGGGHNLIQTNGRGGTIGGGEGNTIQTNSNYGTVGGGGANTVWANAYFATIGGGWANAVGTNAIYGSVGGGWNNTAGGAAATVAGGSYNAALGDWATISGGRDTLATNTYATVPGGRNNLAGGSDSFAAGRRAKALHDGAFVWADSTDADFTSTRGNQFLIRASGGVGIGVANPAAALDVAGTVKATSLAVGTSGVVTNLNADLLGGLRATNFWQLGGNSQTTPGQNFIGTTDNQPLEFKVNGRRALRLEPNTNGAPNVVSGSERNFVASGVIGATIAGGGATMLDGKGHLTNAVMADFGVVGGGYFNRIQTNASGAAVAGGSVNWIQTGAAYSTVGGGYQNTIQSNAYFAVIAGGGYNMIQTNAFGATIGGGIVCVIQTNTFYATVAGGYGNTIQANARQATIGGGIANTNSGYNSTIAGGYQNTIQTGADNSTIGGGLSNVIQTNANYATIGGGGWNYVGSTSSTVAGGYGNTASGQDSVVAGGFTNSATGLRSTVPGGYLSLAGGDYSFAAGRRAKAMAYGDFVWADSTDADFATYVPDQFAIRAAGGVYVQSDRGIGLNAADRPLITRGFDLFDSTAPAQKQGLGRWGLFMEPFNLVIGIPGDDAPGRNFQVGKYAKDGSWVGLMLVDQTGYVQARVFNPTSDRAAKENFTAIDSREILDKVARLPLSHWNFKQDTSARHLGPMAQDFYAAFGLGTDDKHIATVDADGVALAAIQGLNEKVQTENAALRAENAELRTRLEQLEMRVSQMKGDTK